MEAKINAFDLAQSYRNLEQLAFNEKIAQDEYEQILAQLEGSTQEKLDNLNYVLQEFAGKEDTLKQRIKELRNRKKRFKQTQIKIKQLIMMLMQASQKEKIATTENTFSLIQGREKLIVVNKQAVPAQFIETSIKVKKRKALQHYRNKEEIPAGFKLTRSPDYVMVRSK